MDRQQLRRQLRQQRRALSERQRQHHASAMASRLAGHTLFLNASKIAIYLPNDGEMDLRPLQRRAETMGKHCYLPVIGKLNHNRLWFAKYRQGDRLRPNLFGIPEPANGKWAGRSPIGLDLILMPLVGFDLQGNRLGMGGGYYDRTLEYLFRRQYWKRPRLIGVAYEFQRLESLESQAWDVPMDGVITEKQLYLW